MTYEYPMKQSGLSYQNSAGCPRQTQVYQRAAGLQSLWVAFESLALGVVLASVFSFSLHPLLAAFQALLALNVLASLPPPWLFSHLSIPLDLHC